jgi:hypothetical protein
MRPLRHPASLSATKTRAESSSAYPSGTLCRIPRRTFTSVACEAGSSAPSWQFTRRATGDSSRSSTSETGSHGFVRLLLALPSLFLLSFDSTHILTYPQFCMTAIGFGKYRDHETRQQKSIDNLDDIRLETHEERRRRRVRRGRSCSVVRAHGGGRELHVREMTQVACAERRQRRAGMRASSLGLTRTVKEA